MLKSIKPLTTVHTDKNGKMRHAAIYLSSKERKELIRYLGDACCIVYGYYLEKANQSNPDFSDEVVARGLGYSVRKVRRCRDALTKAHWFIQKKFKRNDSFPMVHVFLGKKSVESYLNDSTTYIHNQEKIER